MNTKEVLNNFDKEEAIKLFNAKKTDKEIYDLLVSKGLTDSYETFILETSKIVKDRISTMSKSEILEKIEGIELDEEQLAQIAGGKGDNAPTDTEKVKMLSMAGFALI